MFRNLLPKTLNSIINYNQTYNSYNTLLQLLTQTPGSFCFYSLISITISSALYESCRAMFHLKIEKIISSLTPLSHNVLQNCLLSIFLYVVATKVVTLFNNDGRGLRVYRQKKNKIENNFSGEINYFARLKPILIYETASSSKMNFSKNLGIISY